MYYVGDKALTVKTLARYGIIEGYTTMKWKLVIVLNLR